MDRVELPRVDAKATLSDAIALMKKADCRAVFVDHPSAPRVLELDIILNTLRSKGDRKVGSVKPRVGTVSLPDTLTARKAMSTDKGRMNAEQIMDSAAAVFAVARVGRAKAILLTRHEYFAYGLRGVPSLWRCKQDSNHVWQTGELSQPGDRCRYDGSDVEPV